MQKWCKVKQLFNTLDFRIDAALAKDADDFEQTMLTNATFCQIASYMNSQSYTVADVLDCLNDFGSTVINTLYTHPYDLEIAACLLLLEMFEKDKDEIRAWCATVTLYIPNTHMSACVASKVFDRVTTPKITLKTRRLQLNKDGDW